MVERGRQAALERARESGRATYRDSGRERAEHQCCSCSDRTGERLITGQPAACFQVKTLRAAAFTLVCVLGDVWLVGCGLLCLVMFLGEDGDAEAEKWRGALFKTRPVKKTCCWSVTFTDSPFELR